MTKLNALSRYTLFLYLEGLILVFIVCEICLPKNFIQISTGRDSLVWIVFVSHASGQEIDPCVMKTFLPLSVDSGTFTCQLMVKEWTLRTVAR